MTLDQYRSLTDNEIVAAHQALSVDVGELYHSMSQSDPAFDAELDRIWRELRRVAIVCKERGIG